MDDYGNQIEGRVSELLAWIIDGILCDAFYLDWKWGE